MTNTFYLYLKVIRLNPETGKAYVAPCEITPQICINLNEYVESVERDDFNFVVFRKILVDILESAQKIFNCPLGWLLQMETAVFDLNSIITDDDGNPSFGFAEPERKQSQEFAFNPPEQTEINLDFVKDWIFAPYRNSDDDAAVENSSKELS